MSAVSLYEISQDERALEEILLEAGGDVTDADIEATLDGWFAELATRRAEKIESYCRLILDLEAREAIRMAEARRLQASAQAAGNAARRLKGRLVDYFQATGLTKLQAGAFTPRIQRNGGIPPLELLVPVEQLPEDVIRLKPEANTGLIRERIHNGERVEYARELPVGFHLRIG